MSHVYTPALGLLDVTTLTGDMRALLVMSNSDADTLVDAEFIADFSLDEYDGASYVRKTLASEAFAADLPNDRWEFDFANPVWSTLGVGARQCIGVVIFLFVTNDADSKPIYYINTGGFPFDGNGTDFTVTVNAEGSLQVRNAD